MQNGLRNMKIVTIGGGEIHFGETDRIDRYICGLSGVDHPRVLFIPTASGDAPGYCDNFASMYRDKLGCHVDQLLLLDEPPDLAKMTALIRGADVIYVGGGNTRLLLNTWRKYGVDTEIRNVALKGTVLSGLSAGAICWYESGLSDSDRFDSQHTWKYTPLPALGWLPGMFCPHLDAESRHGPLIEELLKDSQRALACDNGAAISWDGNHASVITARQGAFAYTYAASSDTVVIRRFGHGETITF